jgi:hypothetical protein
LHTCAANLAASNPSGLEAIFVDEFVQFSSIIAVDEYKTISHMIDLLKADRGLLLSSFPNLGISLRIYLTIHINNYCHRERSFSTLSRVKKSSMSYDESTKGSRPIIALELMCIESELLRNLDFDEVIAEFAVRNLVNFKNNYFHSEQRMVFVPYYRIGIRIKPNSSMHKPKIKINRKL